MTILSTTYGLGGLDPEKPDGNLARQVEDNGDGTITVTVWTDGVPKATTRPATAEEQAAATARVRDGNERTLHDRARTALTGNATYLALGTPTNAQTVAQVRALTRQMSALIRLTLDDLDDITGT